MSEQDPLQSEALFSESRRDVLKGIGAAATVAAFGLPRVAPAAAGPTQKYEQVRQWTIVDTKGTREFPGWIAGAPEIWCYTSKMSYTEGDDVDLRVHTSEKRFSVRIERDGHEPELVFEKRDVRGIAQRTPDNAAIKGCNWKPALSVPTASWKPGFYIVYLTAKSATGQEARGEHFFVIHGRQPGAFSKTCVVLSTCTYTAYNDWGGANTYRSIRDGISTDVMEPVLSLQRPWARGFVIVPPEAPDVVVPETPGPNWRPDYPQVMWALANNYSRHYPDAGYAIYEGRFAKWAERNGYALEFATQHDLHLKPEMFRNYKCLVIVGHDEYCSWEMRDTLEAFVDGGGHIARFGGNFATQVRLEDDGRTQVCYKNAQRDPVKDRRASLRWDSPTVNRPQAQTLGLKAVGYSRYGNSIPRASGGFTVYRPWHWAFEKTDLYYGDVFGAAPINVFGFEPDGLDFVVEKGLPHPTPKDSPPPGLQILAMAPAMRGEHDRWSGEVLLNSRMEPPGANRPPVEPGADLPAGTLGAGMIVYFERGQGSVFNAGTCSWVRGLDADDYYTVQITKNVLKRFNS
jgi:hypothetical protein